MEASDVWSNKEGNVYRCDREGKGGGVALFVSEKYFHQHINTEVSLLEIVAVEVNCPWKIVIVVIYIPPGMSKCSAAQHLHGFLGQFDKDERIVIVGDLNENLLDVERHNPVYSSLVSNGYQQHVEVPTSDYGSLLDHVYTRNIDVEDIVVDVQDAYYSDHDKTFCFIKL